MNFFKVIFAILAFSFTNQALFAQSAAKMQEKAEARVEKLNDDITSVDEGLALTKEQREEILALELKKLKDIKKVNKSDASDEEKEARKKDIRTAAGKELHSILSKEQRMAKKAAKEAKEDKD